MLRNLFKRKPRLDAPDPEDRIAALAALGREQQATVVRVFQDDPDRSVRLAALERIEELEPLVAALSDEEMTAAVAQRLLSLIDDATPLAIRNHPRLLRAQVAEAQNVEDALAAAERIEDAAERAIALADNPRADVRLGVAEANWKPNVLAELEKATRIRDKAVHRLVRDRLAQLKSRRVERDAQDRDVESTLAAATALSDDDAHYDARRDAIEREWQRHVAAIEATDEELACFGVVRRDVEVLRGRFPARRHAPKPVAAAAKVDFAALLEAAESLQAEVVASVGGELTPSALRDFKRNAEDLTTQWSGGADIKPPSAELSAAYRATMAAVAATVEAIERAFSLAGNCRDLLKRPVVDVQQAEHLPDARRQLRRQREAVERMIGRFDWPVDLAKPADLTALETRLREIDSGVERSAERQADMASEIATGITKLRGLVDAGAVADAVVLERHLRDLAKQLPKEALPDGSDLADLGGQVRRLRDWRIYAEASKRETLCEQLEQLAEKPLEIHEQAESVKLLRQQWNELGPAETKQERDLRRRFEDAAERAFEPCRSYFKEQAAQRKFNLQQREAIVAALESFVADNDWEHADWRGVERVLRQARTEWREYHPVERKAGRETSKRFEALADELHKRLKGQWGHNAELKEAIVAEAKEINESGGAATDKAEAMKALQRRWKAVGATPRRVDQRLWKLFRAECDSVFEARNAVRDRHDQRQRTIAEANALLAELEKRVDIDPALDRNTVADYQRRLEELEGLPNELRRQADAMLEHADRAVIDRQAANAVSN